MRFLDALSRRTPPGQAVTLNVGLLVTGFVAILAGAALWRDTALDQSLFHVVNDFGPAAPALWSCLTVAGLGLSAWIIVTAFAHDRPERTAQFLWIFIVGGTVASVIKHRLRTSRPLLELGAGHMNVIGESLRIQSMPSGHSAMAFAMLAILVAERRRFDERGAIGGPLASTPALAVAIVLACAIALSRLAVGAHWPADALAGAGLGLVFGALAPHAWPVAALSRGLATPIGKRTWAVVLVVCAASIGATPSFLRASGLEGTRIAHMVATGYPLAEPLQWVLALVALAGAACWWRSAARRTASR